MKQRGRTRHLVGIALALVLVALFLLYRREQQAQKAALAQFEPAGWLVTVGEHKLHLYCTGESQAGRPTVILEAGGGESHLTWSRVQPELDDLTQVCSYDRAGYGWGEPAAGPRHVDGLVEELHTLLQEGVGEESYLLAGHSLGGMVIRRYAQRFPDEVAGLVFVDSTDADVIAQYSWPVRAILLKVSLLPVLLGRALAPFGGIRWLAESGVLSDLIHPQMPRDDRALAAAFAYRPATYQAALREESNVARSAQLIHESGGETYAFPITVIIAPQEGTDPQDLQGRRNLTALSGDSRFYLANGADHYIQLAEPALVVEAVRQRLTE